MYDDTLASVKSGLREVMSHQCDYSLLDFGLFSLTCFLGCNALFISVFPFNVNSYLSACLIMKNKGRVVKLIIEEFE